jgi:isopenicillin N synthase-like dioxygenase
MFVLLVALFVRMVVADDGVPVIDISSLFLENDSTNAAAIESVAREIRAACESWGFFYIRNHRIDQSLIDELESLSRTFFALPLHEKLSIEMSKAGRAWRGFFAVGSEFTSGKPDQKEGIYLGEELPADDPRVVSRRPMHGANLFPAHPERMRTVILDYMQKMQSLAHVVVGGLALSLGLPRDFFRREITKDALQLFRIFHYPALGNASTDAWSVGAHTDYGLLTLLLQDDIGGLQVKSGDRFIDAPPISGTFVCNLGDMLEKITGGLYRSTLHRVRNTSNRDRLSFPYFFDPSWDSRVEALPGFTLLASPEAESAERWDGVSVHASSGTYGEYLLRKVAKVFPDLHQSTVGNNADEL